MNGSWTWRIAFACIFWGTAILVEQHHLSDLIPLFGGWLLAVGAVVIAAFFLRRAKR